MAVPFVLHRPDLARSMAEVALAIDPSSGSSSHSWLRRTGQGTVLTVDPLPELRRRGAIPVYADLGSDRTRDPAALILDAIRSALRDSKSGLSRAARGASSPRSVSGAGCRSTPGTSAPCAAPRCHRRWWNSRRGPPGPSC